MCPSIGRMGCQICGRFLEHRPSMVGYVIWTVHINGSSTPHVWTLTPNLLWPSLEPGRCVIHCFIVHQRQGKRWGELSTSISGGKGKSREIRLFGKCRHKESEFQERRKRSSCITRFALRLEPSGGAHISEWWWNDSSISTVGWKLDQLTRIGSVEWTQTI